MIENKKKQAKFYDFFLKKRRNIVAFKVGENFEYKETKN
jgi:hypothetical protein